MGHYQFLSLKKNERNVRENKSPRTDEMLENQRALKDSLWLQSDSFVGASSKLNRKVSDQHERASIKSIVAQSVDDVEVCHHNNAFEENKLLMTDNTVETAHFTSQKQEGTSLLKTITNDVQQPAPEQKMSPMMNQQDYFPKLKYPQNNSHNALTSQYTMADNALNITLSNHTKARMSANFDLIKVNNE